MRYFILYDIESPVSKSNNHLIIIIFAEPEVPDYARETVSSSKKKVEMGDWSSESPLLPLEDINKNNTDSLSSLETSHPIPQVYKLTHC